MKARFGIFAALALCAATPIAAAPVDDLNTVIADHWQWWLDQNPVWASTLGERRGDGKLGDISLAAQDRAAATAQTFLDRLAAIADDSLPAAARTDKRVLMRMLSDQITANRFGERMMLFSTYESWFQSFASMADSLPFYTRTDYESYLARLAAFPAYNQTAFAITREALAKGYVQPCAALGGFENTIVGAVAGAPEATRFYEPMTRPRPASISQADWTALQARAIALIRDVLTPEYRAFHGWYLSQYKPKCRATIGASALPQGPAFYAAQARYHTTTDLTPEQIHTIGLAEVARIGARMDALATSAGYPNRAAYVAFLKSDPRFFAKTPEELLSAAARMAKIIDGKLPAWFATLPRLPYGIRAIPAETAETTTTAYYGPGSPASGISGTYWVNTSKLDQRPLWELPALTAHESVPGHHNQIALQQELTLPEFRRHAAGFTAFVEGWGLYSEYLGEQMGLYDTPEKMMGRLSYEMWRACRLVVDTGMHAKGWSKAQAIGFMKDNSALTDANIEAEVNRYISWPGQALGYKIGEIRIRELRARAEAKLGTKFDIRRFHDAVLGQGPVPLDVLDRQIDDWIASQSAP